MKYLLDTHIWLWGSMQPDRLSSRVTKILADPQNELWLSPVSIWELTILCRKGRFRVHPDIPTWVAEGLSKSRLREAPLTIEVALAISSMNFSHGDPADHFLAASAKVFDLILITADDQLLKVPGIRVHANR
jgi:PIN domain nuclease of toxin-antitoxin system